MSTTGGLQVRGIDPSSLIEVERCGAAFTDDSEEADALTVAHRHGVNLVRLRVWVDPRDAEGRGYLGGGNDLGTSTAIAARAASLGMQVMVDLHYSDFWTDPRKQQLPRGWEGLSYREVREEVGTYTERVLTAFVEAGARPARVQVGNEITNGMLWPHGRLPHYDDAARSRRGTAVEVERAFDALVPLLRAGGEATRRVLPEALLVTHLDQGGHLGMYRDWFDAALARGLDTDEIGLSYYPFWHGPLAELSSNLAFLAERYGKGLIVLETAYGYAPREDGDRTLVFSRELAQAGGYPGTPEGQAAYLEALREAVAAVPGGLGLGFVYWEPAWVAVPGTSWASPAGMAYSDDVAPAGASWANQALFDRDGRALPAWGAFRP
ncbi:MULTISPECIES: glycosyl hydrolase 53 family protein [unclassified Actinomyces]|uniref:glycoside hydrolase family 53 protein n=1 Tax=unclassified Actinomyces TaxID=2609248 RepID=UPI002017BFA3|nr:MULTISPECIES: glycosyl hydrolase 53 family protein [unclassified Actinomyces]MCL3777861.1 glycosyl hydrolase 53 family protein [Actinomyces sp. AC-20-1]MCL3789258.1 glycosyl hydrolase 53 family protein [Actinomyces sp. 187325]MCL3791611.1 glycosyl hydrolase 53 family protein [Actinomyces sp. 186855]MCL3793553.1 glycosyl hydrolase 53 family protein [Actinomyces sp. 217892]